MSRHRWLQAAPTQFFILTLPSSLLRIPRCRLTCYTGNKPFTNDVLTNWDNASGPPWESV